MKVPLHCLMVGDRFVTLATGRRGKVIRWLTEGAVPVRLEAPQEEKVLSGQVVVELLEPQA